MSNYEMRPCGGSWTYCDGQCEECAVSKMTTTTSSSSMCYCSSEGRFCAFANLNGFCMVSGCQYYIGGTRGSRYEYFCKYADERQDR